MKSMCPDYLCDYVSPIDSLDYFIQNKNWTDSLQFKGKITYESQTKFRILYSGKKYEDGLVSGYDKIPLVIIAESLFDNKRIVLFDERNYGYETLLIEKKEYDAPHLLEYIDDLNSEAFEIFIWTNSSVDFYDEFDFKNSQIELLNGEKVDIKYLRKNAFDYIGILIKNADEKNILLLDLELS